MASTMMRSTAIAAFLSLPLNPGAAVAQQSQSADQPQQPAATAQDATGQQAAQAGSGDSAGPQSDSLVATVGDAEIRGSDVMSVIGMLPPRLQSQAPQMLVPIALEQLILRELILEQAREQNLAGDPEVAVLVEGAAQEAEEDAMVQVWIDRQLAGAVTEEAVQRVYDTLQPQGTEAVPPVEQLRPQIEEHLRQQAMQEIQNRLRQDAEVVFYDPSGQPVSQEQSAAGGEIRGAQNTSSDAGASAATSGQAQTQMQADADAAEEPPLVGGWVGVQIQDVTPQIARALGLPDARGALVAAVEPGSPAAEAGIEPGSVVVAVDDTQIEGALDLASAIAERGEGAQVALTLRTEAEQTEEVAVTIGERPSLGEVEGAAVQADEQRPRLGVAVAVLSPEVRNELRLPADLEGLIISRVEEGSPAAQADIAQGDVIVSADRSPIPDVEALREAAATARDEGRPLLLRVYKDGAYSYIPLELSST